MIRINLLPTRQAKKKAQGLQQLVALAAVLVVLLAANFWWYAKLDGELGRKQAEIAKLKADIAQLDQIIGEITNISKDKQALEEKLAILAKLRAGRTGPVKMLDALATVMPERVWLTHLDEKGGRITLKGAAVSNEDLADLMRALKQNELFSEPSLKRSVQKDDRTTNIKYIEFELTCGLKYPA